MKLKVIAIFAVVGIVFIFIFMSVPWITGMLTGWKRLSDRYPFSGKIPSSHIWRNCSVPNLTLKNFLTVSLDNNGMYFEMPLWFQIGNPPLFIPWSKIYVSDSSLLGKKTIKFSFHGSETTFHFYSAQANEFKKAAGSFWPKVNTTN